VGAKRSTTRTVEGRKEKAWVAGKRGGNLGRNCAANRGTKRSGSEVEGVEKAQRQLEQVRRCLRERSGGQNKRRGRNKGKGQRPSGEIEHRSMEDDMQL
jgi:hypothetical protein